MLVSWEHRPEEIANLLNPHFCAEILRQCIKKYATQKKEDFPYPLTYLVLPITLHKLTRFAISSSRVQLHTILQRNQELKVGFADRARRLVPFTQEAIMVLLQSQSAVVEDTHIRIQSTRVRNKPDISDLEINDCFKTGGTIGALFAKAGTVENIYFMWGVKP